MHARNGNKFFLLGVILLCFGACASFSYKFYYLRAASYDGTVIADKPENDIPFAKCAPRADDKNPCVVMFREEFYRLKSDFEDTRLRLDQCERNNP